MIKKIKINSGFTLVEMLIAVTLFVLIAFISIGSLLSIFDANRKAQSSKTIVDNLNLTIENMARTVRFGADYHCGTSGTLSNPQDCSAGDTFLTVSFGGGLIAYRLNGTAIQRSDNPNGGSSTYTDITAPEAVIEYLKFYVFGTSISDTNQPYVVAVIKGRVGNKTTSQSVFSIETLMSQRTLDI